MAILTDTLTTAKLIYHDVFVVMPSLAWFTVDLLYDRVLSQGTLPLLLRYLSYLSLEYLLFFSDGSA